MSAMQPWLDGARVLDLFAGSGALGLEALSRGAAHVTFVERARAPLETLRQNVERLGARRDEVEVVRGDAMAYVRRLGADAFDLAVADPPYGRGFGGALLERWREQPFARSLWLEHAAAEKLELPADARTRRYGDTAITTVTADPDPDPETA